jgi:hypothetical protein
VSGALGGLEECQLAAQSIGDRCWGEGAQAGGGEFEGEGQSVACPADVEGRLDVVAEREVWLGFGCPVGEEQCGVAVLQRAEVGAVGNCERTNRQDRLSCQAEGFAGGGQKPERSISVEELFG